MAERKFCKFWIEDNTTLVASLSDEEEMYYTIPDFMCAYYLELLDAKYSEKDIMKELKSIDEEIKNFQVFKRNIVINLTKIYDKETKSEIDKLGWNITKVFNTKFESDIGKTEQEEIDGVLYTNTVYKYSIEEKKQQVFARFPYAHYVFIVSPYTDLTGIDNLANIQIYVYESKQYFDSVSKSCKWLNKLIGPMDPIEFERYKHKEYQKRLSESDIKDIEVFEDIHKYLNMDTFSQYMREVDELTKINLLDKLRSREFFPFADDFDLDESKPAKISIDGGITDKDYVDLEYTDIDRDIIALNTRATIAMSRWLKTIAPDDLADLIPVLLPLDNKICIYCGEIYNKYNEECCPKCKTKNPDFVEFDDTDPDWISEEDVRS